MRILRATALCCALLALLGACAKAEAEQAAASASGDRAALRTEIGIPYGPVYIPPPDTTAYTTTHATIATAAQTERVTETASVSSSPPVTTAPLTVMPPTIVTNARVSSSNAPPQNSEFRIPNSALEDWRAEMLRQVNAYRFWRGKANLGQDGRLDEAAQIRADEMARTGVFSHTRPDGRNCRTALSDAGFALTKRFGENIACGQTDVRDALESWKASAGHRENLLSDAGLLGVGVARSADGVLYWVQLFS